MIGAILLAPAFFTAKTPEAERQRIMSAFFDPPPGKILTVSEQAIVINEKQPFTIKGRIEVRPPKGRCVTVRQDPNQPDKRFCKPGSFEWEVYDLDALGRLTVTALSDEEWDEGTYLRWKTPYRVATGVPVGDAKSDNFEDIPIKSCTAREIEGERSIVLETFQGRKWTITLPEFDTFVDEKQKELPNLLINLDSKQMTSEEAAKMNESKSKTEKTHAQSMSALAQLLTKGYKELEKKGDSFHVTKRNAFVMESGRFNETGAPRGMTGKCRYKFLDAPGDPESGIIECFETDTFDSVFTLVTCFPELKPRPKSSGK